MWQKKEQCQWDDLLQLVPKLLTKVDSLETELKQTKLTMGKALVKLVKKVKKMEDVLKRRHVVLPDSEDEDAEISSKQWGFMTRLIRCVNSLRVKSSKILNGFDVSLPVSH
ncbi:hypothetical protein Tco_0703928 [Tanacetum coccineum]|uniref:Uncharacterized protein n=1 Tax=Tanacetum coccineum TaxID=301880 RepID=A0ABQ4Y128_9ASTR